MNDAMGLFSLSGKWRYKVLYTNGGCVIFILFCAISFCACDVTGTSQSFSEELCLFSDL